MDKRVAILGSGLSGLASAKSSIECGLLPVIFEKSSDIGGVWHPETGLTWSSMHTNLSKYTCMFSDFPWEQNDNDFPSSQEVYAYIQAYAEKFNLRKFINFNCLVTKVKKNKQKWIVEWRSKNNSSYEEFDFVIVATGIFSKPYFPNVENLSQFTGQMIHSKVYKSPGQFRNKKVVVVGGAYSGAEISSDIAIEAKQVINVVNKPFWVLPRYIPKSKDEPNKLLPLDLVFYKRAARLKTEEIIFSDQETNKRKNQYFSSLCREQELIIPYLRSEDDLLTPPRIIISDKYVENVKNKKILIKESRIKSMSSHSVIFENGDEENCDAIVFCTGYKLDLPFFEEEILNELKFDEKDQFQPIILHKCTFQPKLTNLAFVGIYRGPYFAVMELQARWANMVFSGQIDAPSEYDMAKGLAIEFEIKNQNPRPQFPHRDYVGLADSLALEIKALPNFNDLKLNNPKLYNLLWNNPVLPIHYRLTDPGINEITAPKLLDVVNNRIQDVGSPEQLEDLAMVNSRTNSEESLLLSKQGFFGYSANNTVESQKDSKKLSNS